MAVDSFTQNATAEYKIKKYLFFFWRGHNDMTRFDARFQLFHPFGHSEWSIIIFHTAHAGLYYMDWNWMQEGKKMVFDYPPKMMKYIGSSGDCIEYVDRGPEDLSHMLPRGSALKRCQRALEEWSAWALCCWTIMCLTLPWQKCHSTSPPFSWLKGPCPHSNKTFCNHHPHLKTLVTRVGE